MKDISAELEALERLGAGVDKIKKEHSQRIDELQESVRSMKDNSHSGGSNITIGQIAVQKLKEAGLSPELNKGERKHIEVEFVAKSPATFTTGNVDAVGSNSIPFSLADGEPGLTRVQRRRPYLMDISNVSSTSKMYVQWSEQENPDGSAGATAEGSDKSQVDWDWVEKSQKVEKITAFTKVSREALDDLDSLQNDINSDLMEQVMLKTDDDLLSGGGTTPNLKGLLEFATAYSAGSFAGTIIGVNNWDVLRTAVAQVVGANFSPNYILLNPVDAATMDLSKSGDDFHYVLPPFKSQNGQQIAGVRILENNGVPEGEFVVGDFSKFNIKVRKAFGIDVGYENDDFTKNLVTIIGELRLTCYVKSNHTGAFVHGEFSEAISALTASE